MNENIRFLTLIVLMIGLFIAPIAIATTTPVTYEITNETPSENYTDTVITYESLDQEDQQLFNQIKDHSPHQTTNNSLAWYESKTIVKDHTAYTVSSEEIPGTTISPVIIGLTGMLLTPIVGFYIIQSKEESTSN